MSCIIYEIIFVEIKMHEFYKYDQKSEGKDACQVKTARSSNYFDVGHNYVLLRCPAVVLRG